jgi:hypothetical protein
MRINIGSSVEAQEPIPLDLLIYLAAESHEALRLDYKKSPPLSSPPPSFLAAPPRNPPRLSPQNPLRGPVIKIWGF